jgi:predicted Zn-ribbon and HTH transcriptional regulator
MLSAHCVGSTLINTWKLMNMRSETMITIPFICRTCGEIFPVKISMKRGQRKQPCPKCKGVRTTYADIDEVVE